MGHVHLKLVAWKQLGVATGTLAAGEPARQKLLVLTMETAIPGKEGGRREGRGREEDRTEGGRMEREA